MNSIALVAEVLLTGGILPVLLFVSGWLVLRKYRPLIRQWLVFSNTLLLIGAVLFLLPALYQLLAHLPSGDEYEQYAFWNRLTGPYWLAYWGTMLGKGWLPQLLWWKRLRRSIGVALAFVPFLLVDFWLPWLYASLHRDYLPASWWILPPNLLVLAMVSGVYLLLYAVLFEAARRLGLVASAA